MDKIHIPVRIQDGILTAADNRPLAPLHTVCEDVRAVIVDAINEVSSMTAMMDLARIAMSLCTQQLDRKSSQIKEQQALIEKQAGLLNKAETIMAGLIKENEAFERSV